jgi:hypothetical protein
MDLTVYLDKTVEGSKRNMMRMVKKYLRHHLVQIQQLGVQLVKYHLFH